MSDVLRINFVFAGSFTGTQFKELVEFSLNNGCRPSSNGSNLCSYTTVTEVRSKEASVEDALEALLTEGGGTLTLYYHDLKFWARFLSSEVVDEEGPQVSINMWASQFKVFGKHPKAKDQGRVGQLMNFIRLLSEQFDPLYVFGGKEQDEMMSDLLPSIERLEAGEVNRLFWLNVFSPAIVERLGRDRVLSAPAWMVEELDDGRVLLVISNNPVHPSKPWDTAGKRVSEHLNLKW